MPIKKSASEHRLSNLFRGIMWTNISNIFGKLLNLIGNFLVLLMLTPEDYGLVALSSTVVSLASIVQDLGMNKALIQTNHDLKISTNIVYWSQTFVCVLLFCIVWACSPFFAEFYKISEVSDIIRVTSVSLLLNPLFSTHISLAIRNMRFKEIAYADMISSFSQLSLAILLAHNGYGYWSLVFSTIFKQVVGIIIYRSFIIHWKPNYTYDAKIAKELLHFGGWQTIGALFGWLQSQIFTLLIAKYYSVKDVGVYNIGNQYGLVIYNQMVAPLVPVIYSYLCGLRNQIDLLHKDYRNIQKVIISFVGPLSIFVYLLLPDVANALLPEKWKSSVPFIQIFVFSGILSSILMPDFEFWKAIGRPDISTKYDIVRAAIVIPVYWLVASHLPILDLALAYLFAGLILSLPFHIIVTSNLLRVNLLSYIKVFLNGLVIMAITASMISLSSTIYLLDFKSNTSLLLARILLATIICFTVISFSTKRELKSMYDIIKNRKKAL